MRHVPAVRVQFTDEEIAAVEAVLRRGQVIQGPEVAAFEQEFSELVAGRDCTAVNSGTSALHLGLLAAGIGPGDEVIVPSFSFAATANAVTLTGARAVFADIDSHSYCIDSAHVASLVGPRTKGVIAVHIFGHVANMLELQQIASRAGLLLIEDAAQAHGSRLGEIPAGALGDLAAFSFYATKNLSTGEGGMVVCSDDATARRVRLLRNQGMEQPYQNEMAGFNNRMTDISAAIGRIQLRLLLERNERRRAIAHRYDQALQGMVTIPAVARDVHHVYHQYTVRVPERDLVLERLNAAGVGARVYYPVPIHRLPAYRTRVDLPVTESATREVLSLPVYPSLSASEIEHVTAAVAEVVGVIS